MYHKKRRTSVGRGKLATIGVLLTLALGALSGCGGSQDKGGGPNANLPPTPGDAGSVQVRVSGTEGTAYTGDYGSTTGDLQIVDDNLEGEPQVYEVEVEQGVTDGVTAFFQKTQPGGGQLKAEILADGEVVVESTTYAEFGQVGVDWFPQGGALEEGVIEEGLHGENP